MRKAVHTDGSPHGIWRQELCEVSISAPVRANNLTRDLQSVPR
jgi:hypothetical protein